MRKLIPSEVIEAVKKAVDEAKSADCFKEGGSCNFDSPYIVIPKGTRKAVTDEIIEGIAAIEGLYATEMVRYGTRMIMLPKPSHSQGFGQTNAARAVASSMTAQGYDASVWYAMD